MLATGCSAVGAGCGAGVASAAGVVAGAVGGAAVGAPVGGAAVGTAVEGPVQAVRTTSAIRRVARRRCFTLVSLLFDEAAGRTRASSQPHLTIPMGARTSCLHQGGTSSLLSEGRVPGRNKRFAALNATCSRSSLLYNAVHSQANADGRKQSFGRPYATMTSLQKRTAETPGAQRTSKTRYARRSVMRWSDSLWHLPLRTLRRCGDLPFLQWTQQCYL
jgi:hypothetical protein